MRILTTVYASPAAFLRHAVSGSTPAGATVEGTAFFYPTRTDLSLHEKLLCELSFPGLPNRVYLRGTVTGFDAYIDEEAGYDGLGVWIAVAPGDRPAWEYALAAARGERAAAARFHPRFPTDLPVRYQVEGGAGEEQATCADLGPGGLFVRTPNPAPVGSDVDLALTATDLGEVVVRGRVSWARPEGMGIRLDPTMASTAQVRRSLRHDSERGRISLPA